MVLFGRLMIMNDMTMTDKWNQKSRFVRTASVNGDAAALVLPSLGYRDVQDTVLEAGGDAVLVDAAGETEGA